MQSNNVLTIRLDEESFVFPHYCSSSTLPVRTVEADWKRPEEIMEYLKDRNTSIRSKVSLFNYEKRGLLTARRISARKIYFDLNQVIQLLKNKENEKP